MTAVTLSARDRKTLFVGVTIIGSLIFISRGIPAWFRWERRIQDAASATVREATASQRAVHEASQLARIMQQVERRYFALAPAFLTGDHPAAIGAALISMVNIAAHTAGVQLGALQVESDTTTEHVITVVRVRGDGAGDVAGITHFLAAVEGSVPLLSVQELTVTPVDPHVTSDKPETVRITFLVEGLTRYSHDDDDHADESSEGR